MRYRALIPVKSLQAAKSRLAPYLAQPQRARLVLTMLEHVITVLRASAKFDCISVVSADAEVLQRASAWGAQALREQVAGHNAALHAAAQHELANGTQTLLTISADLPFICVQDIQALLEKAQTYDVVLVSAQKGSGTNAILARPPLVVPYVFGIDSLQRYIEEAQQHHLSYTIHSSPGLAFDVDTYDDLEVLQCYHLRCTTSLASR
ncbi:MAG TPA: 2-phospho-L-lactate guanylyltransferase [Ktedonobacteraceae bacterium]